jgi:hypothetical protein
LTAKGWDRTFDDPVPLPDGRELVTLRDAAVYVQSLPRATQKREEWQRAVRILIAAAEGRDFLMHARIAMLRALGARRRRQRHQPAMAVRSESNALN